jgi:peptidoglycan hydrolase-like protein with peptidoglycan-binding domain
MTPRQARVALVGFLFLAAGVTINAVYMQGRPTAATASKPVEPAPTRATSRTGKGPATQPAAHNDASAPRAAFDEQPMRIARFGPDLTKLGVVPEAQPEPAADAETIRTVQRELGQRGYGPLASDGVVGIGTRAAIMAFEYDQGLALTGEPSDRLLKRILLGGPAEAVRTTRVPSPQAEDVIRIVQRRLAALGYQGGRIDGRLGDDTVKAIGEFELDQGLIPKGRVSADLVARLDVSGAATAQSR